MRRKIAVLRIKAARCGGLLICLERAVGIREPLVELRRIEGAIRLDGAPRFAWLLLDLEARWAG